MNSSKIKQWGVFLADLNPPIGTKPGKARPVVAIQPDQFNEYGHTSTVVLPISSKVRTSKNSIMRVLLEGTDYGLEQDSVLLVDQIMALDNRKFIEQIGSLDSEKIKEVTASLKDFFGW